MFCFFDISCNHNTRTFKCRMTKTLQGGRKEDLTQKRSKLLIIPLLKKDNSHDFVLKYNNIQNIHVLPFFVACTI